MTYIKAQARKPISIHALRVEGDEWVSRSGDKVVLFQSTPSVWRATAYNWTTDFAIIISIHALRVEGDDAPPGSQRGASNISIHALRVEGDGLFWICPLLQVHFNPRPPCGGRRG